MAGIIAASPQWPLRGTGTPIPVLAHRGAPGAWPENTLEAFAAALALGADGVELDVRRSADGRAMVHHDGEVPGVGPLHLLDAAQLPSWVPTLEQALATCAGAVVDVEVKSSPAEAGYDPSQRLAAEVADMVARSLGAGSSAPAAVMVSSFSPATLEAVHRACPEVPSGLLVAPAFDAGAAMDLAEQAAARALLLFRTRVDPAVVAEAHRRGLAVWCWGVDEEADLASVGESAVDGVVTDHVRRALAVFGRD